MKSKTFMALAAIVAIGFLAMAIGAGEDGQDGLTFEVLSVTRSMSVEGADSTISFDNPDTATAAILVVKVTAPQDIELWAPDFSLSYAHGAKTDDRSRCVGMATAVSTLEDEGAWLISGDYMHVTVKKGVRYVKLLFALESDTTQVTLQHALPVADGIEVPALQAAN